MIIFEFMGKEKIGDIYKERCFPIRLNKNVNLIWILYRAIIILSSFYDNVKQFNVNALG